jgi:hypothetical protein
MTTHICSSREEALELVKQSSQGDCFLIKASRAEALNLLADEFISWCKARAGEESK